MVSNLETVWTTLLHWLLRGISCLGPGRWGSHRLLRAQALDSATFPRSGTLFQASDEIRASNIDSNANYAAELYPPLGYRHISRALVTSNRRCSSVIQRNLFLLPESVQPGPWDILVGKPTVGGILRQREDTLLVKVRESKFRIPRAIFVGTWSPHNWYHWLIDTLPSVFLASKLPTEYDTYPLLLPETALLKQNWLEPLELVYGNRAIINLNDSFYSEVEDLVWIDSPSCPGPLSLKPLGRPNFRIHPQPFEDFRSHILAKLSMSSEPLKSTKRVFIARNQEGNRPYNQEELIEVAENYGFVPVYLEKLSFRESVQLMREAEYLIGPHGAGWASAIFCESTTKAFMWTWEESKFDNWFVNIARLRQFEMIVSMEARTNGNQMHMPVSTFKLQLNKLLDS